ncbi:MAG TPA: hypothetical protein VG455_16350 [Acidimicrobiales bacterium]|nr:hypothetical protein [Acidimicrobiales bacterium]
MKIKSRRRLLVLSGALAAPIVAASAAFACQSLATATVTPKSGPSGTVVNLAGSNYSSSPTSSAIEVHLDSRTGPVLASTGPASRINLDFAVTGSVGYHSLIVTQYTGSGAPVAGTPGRAAFQITSGAASSDITGGFRPSDLATPLGVAGLALSMTAFAVRRRRQATSAA